MIFGIGTDIVQISRIQEAFDKNPQKFPEKILVDQELCIYQQRYALSQERGLRYLATRFSAKEAFSKALGLGFREPMAWHSIQIVNDELGRPSVLLSGSLKTWVEERSLQINISLSDEKEYAIAFVVLEYTS